MLIYAEVIIDAPSGAHKAAGLQSKYRDQIKTQPYLKSHTKESIPALLAAISFYHHHHQNKKNKKDTSVRTFLNHSSLKWDK